MTDDELKAAITTVEGGKLTVATSPDFAPYEFYAIDENGDPQLAGFDMDLAQYIADYLGLSLEIVPMDFDGTIMELQNGNVDLGMAGYSPDPKRADSMDFSDIYITGGQSFVCVESNKDLFTSLEDANNADYQIGAQVGSIQADLAHENTPDADIIETWTEITHEEKKAASWTAPLSRPWWPRAMPPSIPSCVWCWRSPMTPKALWWASPRATPPCWRV